MTKSLQAKLNDMLAEGIENVRALGIDLYDIIPEVRITNNQHRVGSAQDMNRAFVKFGKTKHVVSGRKPLFRISISRTECKTDEDIKNVLYHEIIHCAPNCQDHQATWKAHAAAVNAAYGLNVTVTKKNEDVAAAPADVKDIEQFIGQCFRDNTRTFRFEGLNNRPKNNCDIVDVATGKKYITPAAYVASKMTTSATLFGASVTTPEKKATKKNSTKNTADYSHLVGKKVKNGPRGRKVFTVISIDPSKGSRAVILKDENGEEYHGKIGCAARLVVIG